MEFDKAKFMEKLKELVAYGKKKKSVLEYQEINDFFRDMPLDAEITAWSPFIPTNEDDSGLPAGTLEYRFTNRSAKEVEAVFSYNSNNFAHRNHQAQGLIEPVGNGFILTQRPGNQPRYEHRQFAIFI